MRVRKLAAGASRSRFWMLGGAPLRMHILLWAPFMVALLLKERVLGNRTHRLVDLRFYAPRVYLTYHFCFRFLMHWGKLHVFFWGVG